MERSEILLKPGQQIKPYVPNEVIQDLLLKLYNLQVISVEELNSYDDRNFHIMVKEHNCLPDTEDVCLDGYVLKITNSLDSKACNLIDAQHKMMVYLDKNGLPCPKPIKNIEGKFMSLEQLENPAKSLFLENNGKHIVRLLSFLPGNILYSVPYTKDLLLQVGELVAKTDLALMGFVHDGLKGVDRIWNLSAVPKLCDFIYVIKDDHKHELAMEVIDNFKSHVLPHLQKLKSGPIHGDFNEQNILVKPDENQPGKYVISGILDFGDVHFNYYVFEIAIAICYMMIECKTMDMLDAPGHVLAGYNRLRAIPDEEFVLLKDCISARFCQSLVLGAYSFSQNPDPYLLITSQNGWQCLKALWEYPKDELYKRWRLIIEDYNKCL
ncbi:hydroxylysine kinase-like isoform X2 [Daphnia carinata]|uniref:hydroxylysine kinase-like isoform X2 n=1 Tax=Daphnia carinata TaxID=120202 RepID=UPI002579DF87|nr:hydroxylysine kinase-like isoform X2 [Daphnia carinata]